MALESKNTEFTNIISDIKTSDKTYRIIYVAIGSAGYSIKHSMKTEKGKNIYEQKYMHQFPPFLQYIVGHKFINFHIILIDPLLEEIPFIVQYPDSIDEYFKGIFFKHENKYLYLNEDCNIAVYPIRQNVCYIGNLNNTDIDITPYLTQLNDIAIQDNSLLLFQDFSGRYVDTIAGYFDRTIAKHLDHIIYGLTMRKDFSCLPDLTLEIHDYTVTFIENKITIFNPWYAIINNRYINLDNFDRHNLKQLNAFRFIIQNITRDILYMLGQVQNKINNSIDIINIGKFNTDLNRYIYSSKLSEEEINKIDMTDYTKLYDILYQIFELYFNRFLKLISLDEHYEKIKKAILNYSNYEKNNHQKWTSTFDRYFGYISEDLLRD